MADKEYIEREAVMNALLHEQYGYLCEDAIKAIPFADVRPAWKARWTDAIVAASNLYDHLGMIANMRGYVCGCCKEFSVARYNFCPNCGADMRAEPPKEE